MRCLTMRSSSCALDRHKNIHNFLIHVHVICVLLFSLDQIGPAPMSTLWTILCLDFQYILSMYLNRRYSYMKGIKLCANMLVKNICTSDMEYEPGILVCENWCSI